MSKLENLDKQSKKRLKELITKINNIKLELKNNFIERQDLIDASFYSLLTNTNILMYGPPGTGM